MRLFFKKELTKNSMYSFQVIFEKRADLTVSQMYSEKAGKGTRKYFLTSK